jgi:ubiquinone/menaquinone biosynthesis C-methylase UbiE
MEHVHLNQKQYFERAYQTGSDIWTHIPYWNMAETMLPPLEKDALILDIGAGRGLWAMKLVERGFKVLGIDYIESIVHKVNRDIVKEGYTDRARFMVSNALDMPFTDVGFDMATDIGTLQHIPSADWGYYVDELLRVLKPHAYYLNVSLSQKTHSFLGWHPHVDKGREFSKFGVDYHFLSIGEISHIFENDFIFIDQQFESYDSHSDPHDDIVLVFTLMQKK